MYKEVDIMFFINDWCYIKNNKGRKEKCKVIGINFDGINFKYIIEKKNEEVLENISITQMYSR